MSRIKDSVYTRCNDRIKEDETGYINVEDVAEYNRMQIDSLNLDYDKLADFFSRYMAAISLNQMGYRAIGGRSGLYIHPEKADKNQLGTLFNNSNNEVIKRKVVKDNIMQIFHRKYPDHQMAFDENGNLLTEKTLEEIIEELQAVI